jgi:hypothetical protein
MESPERSNPRLEEEEQDVVTGMKDVPTKTSIKNYIVKCVTLMNA